MKNQELELVTHEILPGLRFYMARLKYCELHVHIDAELGFVMDGCAKIHTMQEDTLIRKGDFFYFNSLEAHEVTAVSEELIVLGIQYSASVLNICDSALALYRVAQPKLTGYLIKAGIYDCLCHLMIDAGIAYFRKGSLFALHCMSLTNEILYLFLNHVPVIPPDTSDEQTYKLRINRLRRILAYIDRHFSERLTITELAGSEHLSVSRVSHFFQEMLHMSFQTYLSQKRFSCACGLLADPACSVTRASEESGFSSTRYLNQLMREHLNMSAMEYHDLHKGGFEALHYSERQDYIYPAAEALDRLEGWEGRK